MATESNGAKTILCLCNGNYCRSPMAEAIDQSFDIPDPGVEKTVTVEEIADLIERCVREGLATLVARAQSRPA